MKPLAQLERADVLDEFNRNAAIELIERVAHQRDCAEDHDGEPGSAETLEAADRVDEWLDEIIEQDEHRLASELSAYDFAEGEMLEAERYERQA